MAQDTLNLNDNLGVMLLAANPAQLSAEAFDSFFYYLNDSVGLAAEEFSATISSALSYSDAVSIQLYLPGVSTVLAIASKLTFLDNLVVTADLKYEATDTLEILDSPIILSDGFLTNVASPLVLDDFAEILLADYLELDLSGELSLLDSVEALLNTSKTDYLRRYLNDVPIR